MSVRLEPAFADELARKPRDTHEAIITAAQGLEELLTAMPVEITVQYTYRLIGGVAVRASGEAIARLADSPAVKSIERVGGVQSC